MLPVLFYLPTPWGWIPVFSYGSMIALGFLLTYFYICRLAHKRGIDDEHVTDLYLVIIVTSIIGARTNYVLFNWSEYADHLTSIPKVWEGGMVYLGGFIGAMVGGCGYLLLRRLPWGPYYDMFSPAVPFACAVGRIGCFLNGCCFGIVSHLPWAMHFPERNGAPADTCHPTQIYEMLILFAITAFMHVFYKRNRRPGLSMVVFVYLYALDRFIIEFFRAESLVEHIPPLGFTLGQTTSIFCAAIAGVTHWWIVKRTEPGPTPVEIEAKLAAA